jgi:predicted HicB family RNase H-like nuclease
MARATTTNVIVRFPPATHEAAKAKAARLGLSLNRYIVLVVDAETRGYPPAESEQSLDV